MNTFRCEVCCKVQGIKDYKRIPEHNGRNKSIINTKPVSCFNALILEQLTSEVLPKLANQGTCDIVKGIL